MLLPKPLQRHGKYNLASYTIIREVIVIRKMAPVKLVVYYPKTEEGKEELARRVSDTHAAAVSQRLNNLNCPTSQKLALLDALIETARSKQVEKPLPDAKKSLSKECR